ncbi:hypothetical protein PMAYCL1PPCAC_32378, partial [Pristionchus mayeri]
IDSGPKMEYEESMSARENDLDFASLDPVKRSYLTFLTMMKPVFSNAYQSLLGHVIYPLFGVLLLLMFAVMRHRFRESWIPVQGFISPFLIVACVCQAIRYCFFVYNYTIGTDRVPTTIAVCSLATYAFSALNYLPQYTITIILAHRVISLHLRSLSVRELYYALAGLMALFLAIHVVHFNSWTLEMAWICRPYRFNDTVISLMHRLLNACIVINPIAAGYLFWAEQYQERQETDKESTKS